LKEYLRQLWKQANKEMAADHLKAWIAKARVSGITILIKFAKTYAAHRTGILVFMIITPQLLRLKAQIIKSKP